MSQGLHKCHGRGNQRKHAHPTEEGSRLHHKRPTSGEQIFPHTDQDQQGHAQPTGINLGRAPPVHQWGLYATQPLLTSPYGPTLPHGARPQDDAPGRPRGSSRGQDSGVAVLE